MILRGFKQIHNKFWRNQQEKVIDSKIRNLCQTSQLASIYALEFRQFSCIVDWELEMALIQ